MEQVEHYRGIKNVEFVWRGTQSDPLLRYKGHTFTYWDIEDALWAFFLEETGHKDAESRNYKVLREFDAYAREHCEDYLDEVIANA